MAQKGFAAPVILFLVLILSLGLAFYILHLPKNLPTAPETPTIMPQTSDTPAPTQKPQTLDLLKPVAAAQPQFRQYTDTEEDFQFQYPDTGVDVLADDQKSYDDRNGGDDYAKNFSQTYGYSSPNLVKGLVVMPTSLTDADKAPFTLWIFDNPDNLSPSRWYDNYWYFPFVWGEYEPRKSQEGPDKESSVSGQPAYYRDLDYGSQTPKFIYLQHNGKMFLFRIATPSSGQEDLGNQILNSFRFTD